LLLSIIRRHCDRNTFAAILYYYNRLFDEIPYQYIFTPFFRSFTKFFGYLSMSLFPFSVS
jgi:hypothetical protein